MCILPQEGFWVQGELEKHLRLQEALIDLEALEEQLSVSGGEKAEPTTRNFKTRFISKLSPRVSETCLTFLKSKSGSHQSNPSHLVHGHISPGGRDLGGNPAKIGKEARLLQHRRQP